MDTTPSTGCPECERLRKELDALKAQFETLQRQLSAARKDSSTSSKPPSSDIVKPQKPAADSPDGKRKIGGQHGHERHIRPLLGPEQLSAPAVDYFLSCCPDCHGPVSPADKAPRILQQFEILDLPRRLEEHRAHAAFCPNCRCLHYAALPALVEQGGLCGPRLTALIAYLKGACHASYSTIRKFLRDVVQVTISRSHLRTVVNKVCDALKRPYDELADKLPLEKILNIDETGHKHNGEQFWTWCFKAGLYTLFKIDPTRSGDVLLEMLGEEFDGVIGCDCFSAYRRYMRECSVRLQFCLAHLIRDVKYLTGLSNKTDRQYGELLLLGLRKLFRVIHARDTLLKEDFEIQLQAAKENVLRLARFEAEGPESRRMAKRLAEYGESYFTFITTPGMEPTNNSAEQAIRFVVIDRKVTGGTRSDAGDRWCERIWTVMASCAQNAKSVFGFLCDAVKAHFTGQKAPSLLPQPD